MNIGEAAKASGVSAKMIRYYEQSGLIAPADRSAVGYRRYGETEVHTLRFIGRARDLGFSMADITRLLALWQDRGRSSADVKHIALQHVTTLRRKLIEIEGMVRSLEYLAQHCHGDGRPDCPILDELTDGQHAHPSQARPPRSRAASARPLLQVRAASAAG